METESFGINFLRKSWVAAGAAAIALFPLGTRIIFGKSASVQGEWGIFSAYLYEFFLFALVVFITLELALRVKIAMRRNDAQAINWCEWPPARVFAVAVLAMCVYFFVRSFFSFAPGVSLQWSDRAVIYSVFAMSFLFLDAGGRNMWLRAIILTGIPVCFYGIFQAFMQTIHQNKFFGVAEHVAAASGTIVLENFSERWLRAYSFFPHPNLFGAYAVIVFAAALLCLKGSWRFAAFFSGLVSVAGIFFSFSRSAFLFFVLCCVIFLCKKKFRIKNGTALIAAAFCELFIFSFVFRAELVPRIFSTGRLEARSMNERSTLNHAGLDAFKKNFWFGVGPGLSSGVTQHSAPPHISILAFAVENGAVGLVLLFTVALSWLAQVRIRTKEQKLFFSVSAILIIAAVSMFDHFWISLPQGMMMGIIFIQFVSMHTPEHGAVDNLS